MSKYETGFAIPENKSKKLLDKVYDHLDTIDVSKLSMRELTDFLEVVQKGRFLETIGQFPSYGFGGLNYCAAPFNVPSKPDGDTYKSE